jgi:hypothetical protein
MLKRSIVIISCICMLGVNVIPVLAMPCCCCKCCCMSHGKDSFGQPTRMVAARSSKMPTATRSLSRNSKRIRKRATTAIEGPKFCHPQAPMRLIYLDLSVSALKKCNANPHHRSTIEEKHCVAQQPPSSCCEEPPMRDRCSGKTPCHVCPYLAQLHVLAPNEYQAYDSAMRNISTALVAAAPGSVIQLATLSLPLSSQNLHGPPSCLQTYNLRC